MKFRRSIWRKVGIVGIAGLVAAVISLTVPFMGRLNLDQKSGEVQAGVPMIEEATGVAEEEGYLYEYEASTFEVLIGEKADKPNFKVKQGLRELDITVNTDYVPSSLDLSTDEEGELDEPVVSPSLEPDQQVVEEVKETVEEVVEPEIEQPLDLDITPEPTPTSTPDPAAEPIENPIGLLDGIFSRQIAQAQSVSPAPSPDSLADANPDVQLINPETEPAVDFVDEGFTLTPTLDKMLLEFEVGADDSLPRLEIRLDNLTTSGGGEKVLFKTRTNREAFSLESAQLTDMAGRTHDISMTVRGSVTSVPNKMLDHVYTVDFAVVNESESKPALTGTATLQVELVSLFQDRMLSVRPVKKNFKATEHLEFEVATADITDDAVKSAMASDELPNLRFGLIDPAGETKQLQARVKERQGDMMTLELSLDKPVAAAGGLFDLLIQHGGDDAYISEEDFSWGVLAMNPDQAVYQEGSEARFDMAVLDKMGLMVCDARLRLEIKGPGGQATVLSTEDGTLEVTEGCFQDITDLPDYTTTYQTGTVGQYALTLTAVTRDGEFTITDSFAVDNSQPFYVKRRGPTRLFPPATYDMVLEIMRSGGPGVLDSDGFRIEELVPSGFDTVLSNGAVIEPAGVTGIARIVWDEQELIAGETKILSYEFSGPDISPALFLVGPLEIVSVSSGLELSRFSETRQWQLANDTDTGYKDPTATANNSTWTNPDNMWTQNDTLADGDKVDAVDMITYDFSAIPAGATIDGVTVEYDSCKDLSANNTLQARLLNVGTCSTKETGVLSACPDSDTYEVLGGTSDTWSCTALTAANVDNTAFGVTVTADKTSGGNPANGTYHVDHARIKVEYTASTGPATEDLMRHGNYFSSETEQCFEWTDSSGSCSG